MRLFSLFVFLFFSISQGMSQFGVSVKYQNNSNKVWNDIYQQYDISSGSGKLLGTSLEYGLNYWFRLKNQRIEFLPEINYSNAKQSFSSRTNTPMIEANRTTIGLNFNTHIYPLDFNNDCNCPTFSKDGNVFTKGFYWIVSPGLSSSYTEATYVSSAMSSTVVTDKSENKFLPKLGLGAGLDIGVLDVLTISPFVLYNVTFGQPWDALVDVYNITDPDDLETKGNIAQLNFGLRVMFRPDYVKKNRR